MPQPVPASAQPAPSEPGGSQSTRVDKWVWSVRMYATRSLATAACDGGLVRVNGAVAKPSAKVRVGDRVEARVGQWRREVEVARIIEKRVGAAVAAACMVDHSPPPPERDPERQRLGALGVRDRGAGRPTKRDRRQTERLRGG